MSIDAILMENIVQRSAGAVGVRAPVGSSAFSDTLRSRAALSSGSADLDAIFEAAGHKHNISPDLLKAVAKVESSFRPNVVSKQGAMGIMQLMPNTAKYLGVTDPFDPEQNIMGGAKYLREQIDRFGGDIRLALAAYNAGWPAVKKHGGIPPFKETQNYVPKVLGYYHGGNISAGSVNFTGFGASGAGGSAAFNEALSKMLFMRIIEMQMNTSGGNENRMI